MDSLLGEILTEAGKAGLAEQINDFIKSVAEKGRDSAIKSLGSAAPVAAAIGHPPLVLFYAALLGGALWQKRNKDQKDEADLQAHFKELTDLLHGVDWQSTATAEKVDAIASHKTWIWARLNGADRAVLVGEVRDEVRALLAGQDSFDGDHLQCLDDAAAKLLDGLSLIRRDTTAILVGQAHQADKNDIAALREEMRLVRQALNDKSAPKNPTQLPTVDARALEAALAVQQNPAADPLARAEAAVLARDPMALREIEALDHLAKLANYKRHQLRGDYHYYRGEFDQAIEPYEKALALRPNDFTARNNTAIAHNSARLGNIAFHQHRAIEIYESTLKLVQKNSRDWAMTQNNLGIAWRNMPTGDRAGNLANAIAAYQAALTIYTREDHPVDWAMTQNNLGIAWRNMPTGDRAGNLAKAIAAYEAALTIRTREDHPVDWAATQNNLGIAWQYMPTGDRAGNLANAIAAYQAALTIRTREDHPVDWAATQNNLGIAWQYMPTGDRAGNLANAIAAYQAALTIYTREDHPVAWAATQNNLGAAWRNMPTGDRAGNLANAIAAYQAALTIYTREDHPVDWAMTHHNLAIAAADLSALPGQNRCELLRRAIASGKAALMVHTAAAFPHGHAGTIKNLEIDRRTYEASAYSAEVPFDAIAPAE